MSRPRFRALDQLRADHRRQRGAIRARLRDFAAVLTKDLFYELVYCLLTPQSSAVHADEAVQSLQKLRFHDRGFDPTPILRTPATYIRFHNTKARRLLELRGQFADIGTTVDAARSSSRPGPDNGRLVREWLVRTVRGLGMKEASHFLRNVGFRNLAILDRHILRNLHYHGVIRTVPSALTTRRYLAIEEEFLSFAHAIGIPMDELDLLFWSRETGEIRK